MFGIILFVELVLDAFWWENCGFIVSRLTCSVNLHIYSFYCYKSYNFISLTNISIFEVFWLMYCGTVVYTWFDLITGLLLYLFFYLFYNV